MNLDIETTVRTIFYLLLGVGAVLMLFAVRAFREANRLRFFLKKRALLNRAWQLVFFAVLIIVVSILINGYGEPATYQFFNPSPTPTLTATMTLTPTVTLTATITNTATITPTLEFTVTPELPAIISEGFESEVTPNPDAAFSPISFSRRINGANQAVDPAETFSNPIDALYGTFSYDGMTNGVQWTALWFRDGELVYYESFIWESASGGYGYTNAEIPGEDWLPGTYEIQIYVGETWKASGIFTVTGDAPTPTMTPTLTQTLSPTPTLTETPTPTNTGTLEPTATLTQTPQPTGTAASTSTFTPTSTSTATLVPTATVVPTATRRSTIPR